MSSSQGCRDGFGRTTVNLKHGRWLQRHGRGRDLRWGDETTHWAACASIHPTLLADSGHSGRGPAVVRPRPEPGPGPALQRKTTRQGRGSPAGPAPLNSTSARDHISPHSVGKKRTYVSSVAGRKAFYTEGGVTAVTH